MDQMCFLEEGKKSSPWPPSFAQLARVVECGHKGDFWGVYFWKETYSGIRRPGAALRAVSEQFIPARSLMQVTKVKHH